MKTKLILLFIFNILFYKANGQRAYTQNFAGWYQYIGDHKFHKKWGIHTEIQLRRNNIITNNQQLLLRGGINFYINPNLFLTAGYCYVKTYPYGNFPVAVSFGENRIYQQLQYTTVFPKIELVQRFRLEQRYQNLPVFHQKSGNYIAGNAVYTNRIRYFQKLIVPFSPNSKTLNIWYAALSNEIFVNFGKQIKYNLLDQNRAFLGLGYKLKLGRIEIGYMNHLLFKSNGTQVENNHTVVVAALFNFDLIKFRQNK